MEGDVGVMPEIRRNERFDSVLFTAATEDKTPQFASKLIECALALCGLESAVFDNEVANASPATKTFSSAFSSEDK